MVVSISDASLFPTVLPLLFRCVDRGTDKCFAAGWVL